MRMTRATLESDNGDFRTEIQALPEDAPHSIEVTVYYVTERGRVRRLRGPTVYDLDEGVRGADGQPVLNARKLLADKLAGDILDREATLEETTHLLAVLDLMDRV